MAHLKDLIVSGIARVVGTLFASTINEGGTNLADKYLGKTAQAADSAKLGGTAASSYATQSWVNGKGYTTNTGTVTSVSISMNQTTIGTITTSGTIDLGNVLDSSALADYSKKLDVTSSSSTSANFVLNRYTEAPTYQVVSMSSSTSTWKIYNTVPSGKEVVYGYPRYVRITNSTSSSKTITINFNVVCGAKSKTLDAGKSIQLMILEPASDITPTAVWSDCDL